MLSAQEARELLKKKRIDRVPDKEREAYTSFLNELKENLQTSIEKKITDAVVNGKHKVEYIFRHTTRYHESHSGRTFFEKDSDYCVGAGAEYACILGAEFASSLCELPFYPQDEIEQLVYEIVEDLHTLDYKVTTQVTDEIQRYYTGLKRNCITLAISWGGKEEMEDELIGKEPIKEIIEDKPRKKTYVDSYNLYEDNTGYAKSQSELKEMKHHEKKSWIDVLKGK